MTLKSFKTSKPIIGMLHIGNLLGTKGFKGVNRLVANAKKDIRALQAGGIDGILIENWKEDSIGEFVSTETAVSFSIIAQELVKHIKVPFGFNILNNDYKLALSLAALIKADFVQLDVFVDNVVSDFKYSEISSKNPFKIYPDPAKVKGYAKLVGIPNIPIFAFIQPKHYKLLEKNKPIEKSAKQAKKAGASALLVTKETGFAPTKELLKKAKEGAKSIPVGIGSGFSSKNAKEYLKVVDFAIVGTSIKKNGITDNPVDEGKVRELMSIVKKSRS